MLLEAAVVRGLGAAALALLVSRSPLLEWARSRTTGLVAEGVRCPFCCSFWAAGALCAVYPTGPSPLLWLASWGVAGLVAAAVDRMAGE